jgi:hypothetical protein
MWMRHDWQFKGGYNAGLAAGAAEQGLGQLGFRVAAKGDGWVLGEINGGLILTQAMGIGDGGDSHVMVVAATENEAALTACNQLADLIRGARTL